MKTLICFSIILVAFFVSNSAIAQKEIYSDSNGAIHGYDPVSYFKKSQPVKGNKAHTITWKGTPWYFESAENLKAFSDAPEKYAPQYGGYCAYGLAKGYKAKISPDAWSIVNGKLYLNYNKDVQKMWDDDQRSFIQQADDNWPTVMNKKE